MLSATHNTQTIYFAVRIQHTMPTATVHIFAEDSDCNLPRYLNEYGGVLSTIDQRTTVMFISCYNVDHRLRSGRRTVHSKVKEISISVRTREFLRAKLYICFIDPTY
jgi:hypothetical protein